MLGDRERERVLWEWLAWGNGQAALEDRCSNQMHMVSGCLSVPYSCFQRFFYVYIFKFKLALLSFLFLVPFFSVHLGCLPKPNT